MTKSKDFGNEKCKIKAEHLSGNSAERDGGCGLLWELSAADREGIESVRAIGAVLQEVFFRFGEFLSAFILSEAVPATRNTCRLKGKYQVFIVLPVDERHEFAATGKGFVYLKILLVVIHRVANIDILDLPTVFLKLVDNNPSEVLSVDGVVRAEGGSVVVVDDRFVLVVLVVLTEVRD